MVKQNKPDLVLMDVQMPEMDGFEATAHIREHEATLGRHTPIIALTAGALESEKERCLQSGMDDFLTKPIDKKELCRVFSKYLNLAEWDLIVSENYHPCRDQCNAGEALPTERLYLHAQKAEMIHEYRHDKLACHHKAEG
jgi:CheY-like chemotaxis protein